MNIFYLDPNPKTCAEMHCDKHVVKMIIEYAQLLSTAHRIIDGEMWEGKSISGRRISRWKHPDTKMDNELYLASHVKHPSGIWIRESDKNYTWLYTLWINLCKEYTHRYGRIHLTEQKLSSHLLHLPKKIPIKHFWEPYPAMSHYPQCIVPNNSLQSYHNYYIADKQRFAKWTKRDIPKWYVAMIQAKKRTLFLKNVRYTSVRS